MAEDQEISQPITTTDPDEMSADLNSAEYEHLLEDYSHFVPAASNEILQGRVLKITSKDVIVDVGSKSEGLVPREQFLTPSGELSVKPGDLIDVMIDHGEAVEGYILLSHEKAIRLGVWENLEKAFKDQLTILGRVISRVKGGLAVDVGIKAFMPGSQIDVRPVRNLDAFTGQDIPVKVVKLNRRRGNVVVSRKLAMEQELAERKAITMEQLHTGAILTGIVKNVTDYGAFIDLGGIDGLLHVTDISWGRIGHPTEILHPGEEISVQVLKYDGDKDRVSLGIKQMSPDPWERIEERYPIQSRVTGRVVNVADYGAFVELEPGIEGLIHISEMTWSRRMKHPSKVVRPGDMVESVVLEVHGKDRRISLGLKQLEADPWTTINARYSVGSVVEGRVRNMTDFGAFIEIEEGIDGLVHVSDLSWTKRIKHPSEVLRKGSVVQAVILAIDVGHKRLSLGIKQLQPDAWESYLAAHNVNDLVRGTVTRVAGFGAFVELAEGVEGLCHFSEIPGYTGRKGEPVGVEVGTAYDFKIIKMNEAEKKIGLSLRAAKDDEERQRLGDYQRHAAAATSGIEGFGGSRDKKGGS